MGGRTQDAAVADLNGDGTIDIVSTYSIYNSPLSGASVLLTAGGVPGAAVNVPIAGGAIGIALADLTGDGRPEIVTALLMSGQVGVATNNGAGGFGATSFYAVGTTPGSRPTTVATADLDHDGRIDIVSGNTAEGSMSVLLARTVGGFGAPTNFASSYPGVIEIGDLDNDSHADVLTAEWGGAGALRPYLGDGAGGFVAQPSISLGSTWLLGIDASLGDLDNNGDLDAVAVDSGNGLYIAKGNGAGGFTSVTPAPLGGNPTRILLRDFDGDGNIDAVTSQLTAWDTALLFGNGAGSFAPPLRVSCGASPFGLAVGEVTGDGWLDVVVANEGTANSTRGFVTLLPGAAGRGLSGSSFIALDVFGSAGPLVAADFDHDHDVDFAACIDANGSPGGDRAAIALNAGTGGFVVSSLAATGHRPKDLAVGDVNGDGHPDLVTADFPANTLTVLLGDGAGGFAAGVASSTAYSPSSITCADFNGDGRADVASASLDGRSLSIQLALLNGVLGPPTTRTFAAEAPTFVTDADVNGDGRRDLLVAVTKLPFWSSGTGAIFTFLGDGLGGFAPPIGSYMTPAPNSFATGDWDRDGKLDVATANGDAGSVTILLGTGTGSFSWWSEIPVGDRPWAAAAADLDADDNLDLVVVDVMHANAAVLLGDGVGNFMVSTWHALHGAATTVRLADVNGDGLPDVLAGSIMPATTASILVNQLPAAFTPYGTGCSGSGGFVPRLDLTGAASPGGTVALIISRGLGGAPSLLFFGAGQDSIPMPGGCTFLVGTLGPPIPLLVLTGSGPGAGSASISGQLALATPIGLTLSTQAFVYDAGVPRAFASSNAVKMTVVP